MPPLCGPVDSPPRPPGFWQRSGEACVCCGLAGRGGIIATGSDYRRWIAATHSSPCVSRGWVWGRQDVEFEFGPGLPLELTEHRAQPAGVAVTAARLLPVTAQHIAAGVHLLDRDILVEVR